MQGANEELAALQAKLQTAT
jgi:hypothetical protein